MTKWLTRMYGLLSQWQFSEPYAKTGLRWNETWCPEALKRLAALAPDAIALGYQRL